MYIYIYMNISILIFLFEALVGAIPDIRDFVLGFVLATFRRPPADLPPTSWRSSHARSLSWTLQMLLPAPQRSCNAPATLPDDILLAPGRHFVM